MKAGVLHQFGQVPCYEEFPDPVAGEGEILVDVKAVALENIDKAMANKAHFATHQFYATLPAVVGFDGIGTLSDGQLVGFGGLRPPYGAMAERTVIRDKHYAAIPAGIDPTVAAAAPSSALTGLFGLKCAGGLQPDETVLINGATGFAGQFAVQIAKLCGAKRVIGTGRDDQALEAIRGLGADEVIDLKQADSIVGKALKDAAGESGYHVILDFLWGHPTELLIESIVPNELSFAKHRIRLIQAGKMAGPNLSLSADALRTSGLEILGGGAGLTPEAIAEGAAQIWNWLKMGTLRYNIEIVPLKDIEKAWQRTDIHGKRLVIVP